MTRATAKALHSLLTAIGTGIATFLTATFATGLPVTAAAWRACWIGAVAAGLTRLFGWVISFLNTTSAEGP